MSRLLAGVAVGANLFEHALPMPSRSNNFRIIAGAHSYPGIENETRRISVFSLPVVVSPSARSYGFQVTDFEHRGPLTNPDMEEWR
jgi:hypothetical protein